MFLHLIESRRVRRLAAGALVASVAVHTAGVGAASRRTAGTVAEAREGPISVRWMLPPDRVAEPPGERIVWVAVGPGTPGWRDGVDPTSVPAAHLGARAVTRATRPALPVLDGVPSIVPTVYSAEDVDSVATRDPESGAPEYPEPLRAQGVQGRVLAEFVVDSTGHAEPGSFHVVEATHPLFADALRDALPRMRFHPATAHGRRVRQLVRLPMAFRLTTAAVRESA